MHALADTRWNRYLGRGIYGLSEAALYIGERPQRVHYWFKSRAQVNAPPLLQSEIGSVEGKVLISFLDLIEAKVTSGLIETGLSVQQVRRAYTALQERWEIMHPFAHRRLFTDGRRVYIGPDDANMSEVLSRQGYFESVIKPFLTQVSYDDATGMAAIWQPMRGVQLNPRVGFGKPVVEGTGTRTEVVYNAWLGNHRNPEFVAELYEISEQDVMAAVRFEESLKKAA